MRTKAQSFTAGRGHIPDGAAAFCSLCRRGFSNVDAYYAHRDMNVAPALRRCLPITYTTTTEPAGSKRSSHV